MLAVNGVRRLRPTAGHNTASSTIVSRNCRAATKKPRSAAGYSGGE
jgi:hypothetical protein